MKKAFTLIELLVVIAIIAILAAILFPVFAQAKVAAKATVVLSNQKQQDLGAQMYMSDYDDIMPSYITRTAAVADAPRDDIVSWVQQFQPYIKNGNPTLPANAGTNFSEVPPQGIFFDSLFSEANWVAAADQPDCDGAGALDPWTPVKWYHAHFGFTFPANNLGVDAAEFGPADPNGGSSAAEPLYHFAGSYLANRTATTLVNNLTVSVSSVNRPADTALITDGFTGVIPPQNGAATNSFGVTFGCESANLYKGGGNVAFVDGHVKFVKGNSQRYIVQDGNGKYYMKFFDIDE